MTAMGEDPYTSGTPHGLPASPGSAVLTPPTGVPAVPAAPPRRGPTDLLLPPARVTPTPVAPCACGHPRLAHEHYRPGSDCGVCGAADCAGFRPVGGPVRRFLRGLGLCA